MRLDNAADKLLTGLQIISRIRSGRSRQVATRFTPGLAFFAILRKDSLLSLRNILLLKSLPCSCQRIWHASSIPAGGGDAVIGETRPGRRARLARGNVRPVGR